MLIQQKSAKPAAESLDNSVYFARVRVAGRIGAPLGIIAGRAMEARAAGWLAQELRHCAGLIVACLAVVCGSRPTLLIRTSWPIETLTVDGASLTADEPLTVDGAAWCGV